MEVPSLYNPDPINGKLVVFLNGEQYTVRANEAIFAECVNAYKEQDWDRFLNSVDPARKIKQLYAKYDQVEVKDGNVYVHGDTVNTTIAQRILQSLSEGLDCTHVFKFVTKTSMNPSARAVNELYTFLEHKDLPITENGNFLAYKAVREDYTDVHSGQFSNVVGAVLQMPRNKVDDDKEVGCSYGFHAGTLEYASGFKPHNGKMVIVEIDPADVVSIPLDSNCQKLRTCRYKVVGEYTGALTESKYKTHFETDNDAYVEEQWADDDFFEEEDAYACENCNKACYEPCNKCDNCSDCCYCNNMAEDNSKYNKTVNVDDLLASLFKNRQPALAMKLRKNVNNADYLTWNEVGDIIGTDSLLMVYNQFNS
jgi:hypothetical protein